MGYLTIKQAAENWVPYERFQKMGKTMGKRKKNPAFHISSISKWYPKAGGVPMAALMIAEDDKKTNEAICEYLKSAGHETVPAYDGAEAIRIFEKED